jgi:hypothetical protein
MTQQGDGSGRPPGGPPWPQQPPQGQWPQQPQNPQQGQWPQQPPQYQQPQQPQYPPQQPQYPPQQPQYPPQQPQYQQPPYRPQQPQQPYAPQQPYYQQPPQQRPPTQPPAGGASIGTAFSRAFRMRIDPSEVTDHEREKLHAAGITSPTVQAFLAWRRSVLIVVAVAILPVLGLRIYDTTKQEGNPSTLNALLAAQLVVDIVFALLLWSQIGRWTSWRRQRRVISVGWFLYFMMPFAIWLYPLRNALDDALAQQTAGDPSAQAAAAVMGPLLGILASFGAMIELAPKAVSLLPGILRGSLISKLLFPGASGPGWLVLLLAPIYAVIVYLLLVIPYQVTASGFFIAAMVGLIGAQVWMGRMGYKLARPERLEEALALVKRVRGTYLVLNLAGITFAVIGIYQLFHQLEIPYVGMVKVFANILVNVLLLTLVATDLIVANLARGQALLGEQGSQQAFATFQRDVSQFADPVVSSQKQSGPR